MAQENSLILADILLRLVALEKILIQKEIVSTEEYILMMKSISNTAVKQMIQDRENKE